MEKALILQRCRVYEQGIVLLTTLSFLSILAIMLITLMHHTLLYAKSYQQLMQQHQSFYELENAARILAAMHPGKWPQSCMLSTQDAKASIETLQEKKGCTYNMAKEVYYYVIEPLGIYPCVQIMKDDQWRSSSHWRLTVSNKDQQMIQLRIAHPGNKYLQPCSLTTKISEGIVSWLYVRA